MCAILFTLHSSPSFWVRRCYSPTGDLHGYGALVWLSFHIVDGVRRADTRHRFGAEYESSGQCAALDSPAHSASRLTDLMLSEVETSEFGASQHKALTH